MGNWIPVPGNFLYSVHDLLLLKLFSDNYSYFYVCSFAQMFGACSTLVHKAQIKRICDTGVDEVPILLQMHPFFEKAWLALVNSMDCSIKSAAKKHVRSNLIRWTDEKACLEDVDLQIDHPANVQKRFCYYCLSSFMIRRYTELYTVLEIDFSTGSGELGTFVKYSNRVLKTTRRPWQSTSQSNSELMSLVMKLMSHWILM